MKIVDLTAESRSLYFVCLEDWSAEMQEAGNHKENWFHKMQDKGLRVKLALDDDGTVGGMIQYLPIEHSFVEGNDLYFIPCIWVHGHKAGRGNFQKRGMGQALLRAAEDDAMALGAKGIAAWGIALPFWMKAAWFRKHGYRKADKQGMRVLLWKPFSDQALPPRWLAQQKTPETVPGQVTVTAFCNGWCPAQNIVFERARRAAAALGDGVVFQEIDTSEPEALATWGIADAVFIDGKQLKFGPPPAYAKIQKKVAKRVKKLGK